MGSSIVNARTARNAADVIFFMVVDPSRIATLIVQSSSDVLVARERVQKSEQVILWVLSSAFSKAVA
jgi:hypothetical protein